MSMTTAAQSAESRREDRIAARLLIGVLLLVVLAAAATYLWGLFALTMIGLAATAVVLVLLVAYAIGF